MRKYPGDTSLQEDSQGAGYHVRDEIRTYPNGNPVLPHTQYAVSMANTGPHSSSSQFLITLVNDAQFDNKNSVFGYVNQFFITYNQNGVPESSSNGWAVVQAIHASSSPVSINNITFRRLDIGAMNYDENAGDASGELALLGNPGVTAIDKGPTHVTLTCSPLYATEVRLYTSIDLNQWIYASFLRTYSSSEHVTTPQISLAHNNSPRAFFWLAGASYPRTASPPESVG